MRQAATELADDMWLNADRYRKLSLLVSGLVFLTGASVLAGWLWNLPQLTTVLPGLATMKVNTAIGLMIASTTLALLNSEPRGLRKTVASILSAFVSTLGLLTLIEYLFQTDLGIDNWLGLTPVRESNNPFPTRMSPISALCFCLMGGALMTLDAKGPPRLWRAEVLAAVTMLTTLIGIAGHLYDVHSLYRVANFSSLALHTAISFLLLGIGIGTARPERGMVALLTRDTSGAVLARRLLPAALVLPILLGWLRVTGEKAGYYGLGFGTAMFATALVMVFVALIWWTAVSLDKADKERQERERLIQNLALFPEQNPAPVLRVSREGAVLFANRSSATLQQCWPSALNGRAPPEIHNPVSEVLKTGTIHEAELTYNARTYLFTIVPVMSEGYANLYGRDVTERKLARQKLEQTVAERTVQLREALGDLEAFSYSIAHDMRAPLRAMQGFAKVLSEDHQEQLDSTAREYLDRIVSAAQRLDALIQDVLNYSRIVRSDLRLEPVDARKLIEEIVATYPNLQPGKAEITFAPMPLVLANQAALTQVFSNLLGNAVKFVKPGVLPRVNVWAEETKSVTHPTPTEASRLDNSSMTKGWHGMVRIWIEDNGIGMEKGVEKRIFDMFQRLNRPDLYEGTGIGLAIVRKAVERMGGSVGVESELDKGSRFWIELKKA